MPTILVYKIIILSNNKCNNKNNKEMLVPIVF